MDKEKLIESLVDLWEVVSDEHDPMQAKGIDRAILLVEDFPDDNQWIPVSEQMPDEFTNIDVWVSITNPFGTYTRKATSYLGKFWWLNGREIKLPVVAWKYARYPEPYKEVSEE